MTPDQTTQAFNNITANFSVRINEINREIKEKALHTDSATEMMQISYLAGRREGIREASVLLVALWQELLP